MMSASVGPHRGCRHPPNSLQGPAVLQCTPIPGGAQPAAPECTLAQATPAISNIMEEVTTYHGRRLFCLLSPVIYLKGGLAPRWPRTLQRASTLFLIPGWVWGTLAAPMGGSLLYQGTTVPTHVTHFHPSLSTQCLMSI